MAGAPAQQRANPRQHFLEMKGLCHIVVGAGIEPLHLVAPAVARGEDQDGHRAAVAPPGFQHRNAVHLRQADVQHHRVIRFAVAEEMPLFAIERTIDHVTGVGQRGRELTIEVGIVFDDEKAQGGLR